WQLRAERVQAAHHPQLPAEREAARRRRGELQRSLRQGHRAESQAHRRAARAVAHARDRAQPAHRLRQGGADREKSAQGGDDPPGGGARARPCYSRAVRPMGAPRSHGGQDRIELAAMRRTDMRTLALVVGAALLASLTPALAEDSIPSHPALTDKFYFGVG